VSAALLVLAVGLIAANGFFVGAEFAVLASRRARPSRCSAAPAGLGPPCERSNSCP
jgi:CBS domain containing-hemolysin-like protein